MKVTARLFAGLRDHTQRDRIEVDLANDATIQNLLDRLGVDQPSMKSLLLKSTAAIDMEHAPRERLLQDGQEIAILPPVSGG